MYKLATFLGALVLSSFTHAAHLEFDDGDLSTDGSAPTELAFILGSNTVSGSVTGPAAMGGNPAGPDVRDFFTFTIDPGFQLTEINLLAFTGNQGFASLTSGMTAENPSADTIGGTLGGSHVNVGVLGSALGAALASAAQGGSGFTFPLGAGDYTFLIQETGNTTSNYELDFVVSQVPLPAAAWLFASGLLGLFGAKRLRASQQ